MKLSNLAKNAAVVVFGMGLILGIEGGLALFGVSPLSQEDRFAGFAGASPVFLPHREGGDTVYTLNPAKERYFNPQSFEMPKPPGTFRIVSFGGSTTYGRPYINETSFPAWLGKLLGELDPAHRYENINLGGISYASYRVRRLMDEAAGYDPDLFVVYSGHNEFLEARTFENLIEEPPALRRTRGVLHHSRIYSALFRLTERVRGKSDRPQRPPLGEEVAARLEEIGGPELYHRDPAFRAGVIRQYRESIESIVQFCRQKDIPLILCTLPSNLSGVSPFKSEHGPGFDPRERDAWEQTLEEAKRLLAAGDPRAAFDRATRAVAQDPGYAEAHFVAGTALRRLGRADEAYRAFVRAKEEDIVPLRALETFNTTVRQVAAAGQVPLADVEARFRAEAPDGIPGPELFADHVHPTLKGQQLVAWVVTEAAVRAGRVPIPPAAWEQGTEKLMGFLAAAYAGISDRYRAMGLWGVGRLFHWAGKYPEAYPPLRLAWDTVKDVPEIPYLLGELELARQEPRAAAGFYQRALELAPDDRPSHYGLAKAHLALGDGTAALAALPAVEARSDPPPTHLLLRGEAELLLDRLEEARADIERAAERTPGVQRFAYALARVRAASGDVRGAREAFRRYRELLGQSWSEGAFQEFQRATAHRPASGRTTTEHAP